MSAHFTWQAGVIKSNLSATTKLVLLVVGARMNMHGDGCFPSYQRIADDASLSRGNVIKHIKVAVDAGWLNKEVRRISAGLHSTNIYSIAFGGGHPGIPPSHLGELVVVIQDDPNTTVLTPQLTQEHIDAHAEAQPKFSKKKSDTTITEWIESGGEITDDDPIWERSAKAAIPEQFISIAWFVFKRKATETGRKQKDWKANFRDAVMRDWLKLWAFNSTTGECYLTTAGKTAERELNG